MNERIKKFISILRIELLDLESDIDTLEKMTIEREKKGEITHYVTNENMVLLKREFKGILRVIESLDCVDFKDVNSFNDAVESIREIFKEKIKHLQYPEVVMIMANRKIDKVLRYMLG